MSTFNNTWENVSSPQSNGWTTDTSASLFWQKQQQQPQPPKLGLNDTWSDAHSQYNGWNAPQQGFASSIPQKYVFTSPVNTTSKPNNFHPTTSLEITTSQPQQQQQQQQQQQHVLSSDTFSLSALQQPRATLNTAPSNPLMFSPPGILQQNTSPLHQQQQSSLSPIGLNGNHSFKAAPVITQQVSGVSAAVSSVIAPPTPTSATGAGAGAAGAAAPKPDIEEHLNTQNLYKTELCRSFRDTGSCRYGSKCQFAHGREELRPVLRHPKYKTEVCKTYHTLGRCPYGKRCRFIHLSPDEANSNSVNILHWGNSWNPEDPQPNPSSSPNLVQPKTSDPHSLNSVSRKQKIRGSLAHHSQQQQHLLHPNSVQSHQQQLSSAVFTSQQTSSDFLTVTYSPSLSKNNDTTHSLVDAFSGLSLSSQPKLNSNPNLPTQPQNVQQQQQKQLDLPENERRLSFFARLTGKTE